MNEMTIESLTEESYATAKEKGWWDNPDSPDKHVGVQLMLMVSELAEAMEEHRHGRAVDEIYYGEDGKPEGIPVEMADVMIRIFDFCGHHKIKLSQAIEEKMAYNKTRPYRHGNKVA